MNDYEIELSEIILRLVQDNKTIKKDEIVKETNESKYMINKIINELKEEGVLERVGGRNKGYWSIISNTKEQKFYKIPIQRILINNDNNDDNTLERYQKDLRNLRNKLTKSKFVFKKWYNPEKILLYYTDFTLFETSFDSYIEGVDIKNLNLQKYPKIFKVFQKASKEFWNLRDKRLETNKSKDTWNAVLKIIIWEFRNQYRLEYEHYKDMIKNLLSNNKEADKDKKVVKIIDKFLAEDGYFALRVVNCFELKRGAKYVPLIKDCIEIDLGAEVIKLSRILLVAYYAIIMFIIEDLIEESKR